MTLPTARKAAAAERPLDRDAVERRAGALIRQLEQVAGDPDDVNDVLARCLEEEDWPGIALVALVALRDVFAEWLTPVPVDELPPGGLVLTERNPR